MTNELEKQFFDTFEIEPVPIYSELGHIRDKYPQITDRILLELICVLGNTNFFLITNEGLSINIDGLKSDVLHSLISEARFGKNKSLKQQVRKLFKEV